MAPQGQARWGCMALWLGLSLALPASAAQQGGEEKPAPAAAPQSLRPKLQWGLEARANYRYSEDNRFPVPFPFTPDQLPPGQTHAFEETVNAGSHLEISDLTLLVDAVWSEGLKAHAKIDAIDLYDRNPTSSDKKLDVDEAWLRFGRETLPATLPAHGGIYLKIGKFNKFERQNDRHLQSYGVVSTAFNRFNDIGAEMGIDLGQHLYAKLSYTQGNPVFMRDPNALAGDNGTPTFLRPFPHPNPTLKSGIVILYDTEVEDFSGSYPEVGAGLGLRFADAGAKNGLDLLAWGYKRRMAKSVDLEGTFYGGDLDLLNGPFDLTPLPVKNDRKRDAGGNLWLYLGGFSFFAQYVDQDLAGLPRTGLEGEVAWRFDLPLVWAAGDRQLFPAIAPAVRYSKLDNQFRNHPLTSSPSFAWDWEKLDLGLRLGIVSGIDLTLEYADNRFVLGSGARRGNNEFLGTLRWRV
jgi:hypothetical protein